MDLMPTSPGAHTSVDVAGRKSSPATALTEMVDAVTNTSPTPAPLFVMFTTSSDVSPCTVYAAGRNSNTAVRLDALSGNGSEQKSPLHSSAVRQR